MTTESSQSAVINQFVHGYRDGHQLLAASCELDADAMHTLLLMSDLLTTSLTSASDSYLCGYPLKTVHRYVFARTWLAMECPRAGSVWTHSLLVDYTVLSRLNDSSFVTRMHRRPSVGELPSFYSSISISGDEGMMPMPSESWRRPSRRTREVAYAVYDSEARSIVFPAANLHEDEAMLRSLWQQMWPRLRRTFSFCSRISSPLINFEGDVSLLFSADATEAPPLPTISDDALELLAADLDAPNSELRAFMARYASDISSQRAAGRLLAGIYLIATSIKNNQLGKIAKLVDGTLPSAADGRSLKLDLLFEGLKSVRAATIESRLSQRARALRNISCDDSAAVRRATDAILTRAPDEVAELLSAVGDSRDRTLGAAVRTELIKRLALERLVDIAQDLRTKAKIAAARPEVLQTARYWPERADQRRTLIAALLSESLERTLIVEAAGTLLTNRDVEQLLADAEPATTIAIFEKAISASTAGSKSHEVFLGSFASSAVALAVVARHSSALSLEGLTTLGRIADGSPSESEIDCQTWLDVAECSAELSDSDAGLPLVSVLFKAALRGELPDAAQLFAVSFDQLHEAAAEDRLPPRVRSNLEAKLPHIGLFRDWDFCAKLRAAVVRKYLDSAEIDPSLLQVTKSRRTLNDIFGLFGDIQNGTARLRRLLAVTEAEAAGGYPEARTDLRKAIDYLESRWY